MIRPDPALAFEVAAEECRLAEERGEVIDMVGVMYFTLHFGSFGSESEICIPTDTADEWGITICAWEEEI